MDLSNFIHMFECCCRYNVSQTFRVQIRGGGIQTPSSVPVNLDMVAGSNYWDMVSMELNLIVKGDGIVAIAQLPQIRVSMTLAVDIQQLLNTGTAAFSAGLANALGIKPSTVRVTGYRSLGEFQADVVDIK